MINLHIQVQVKIHSFLPGPEKKTKETIYIWQRHTQIDLLNLQAKKLEHTFNNITIYNTKAILLTLHVAIRDDSKTNGNKLLYNTTDGN